MPYCFFNFLFHNKSTASATTLITLKVIKMSGTTNIRPSAEEIAYCWAKIKENEIDLKKFIENRIGTLGLTEEVFQESCLRMLSKINTLKEQSLFRNWAFVITANVCIRVRDRKENDEKKRDGYYETYKATVSTLYHNLTPLNQMVKLEKTNAIMGAIDSLSQDDQKICYGFHFEHKSIADLASEHGTTTRTIKSRLANARKVIKSKTKDLMLALLTLRLIQSNSGKIWGQSQNLVHSVLPEMDASLTETAPILMDIIADNASQVAETTTVGAGAVAASSTISPILYVAGMPFVWLISIVLGGQTFGLALIRNAPSLSIRRWLVKQLFVSYCFLALIPTFYFAVSPFLLEMVDDNTAYYFICITLGLFLLIGVGYAISIKSKYRLILSGDSSIIPLTFSGLRKMIVYGFGILTIVLLMTLLLFLSITIIPDYQNTIHAERWEKGVFIISIATITSLLFLWIHFSTFCLFRYFLAISKDDQTTSPIPTSQPHLQNVHWSRAVLSELPYAALFIIMTLTPAILHLSMKCTRPVCALLELVGFSLCWFIVLYYGAKKHYRWRVILPTAVILIAIMATLRSTIYE